MTSCRIAQSTDVWAERADAHLEESQNVNLLWHGACSGSCSLLPGLQLQQESPIDGPGMALALHQVLH